MKQTLHIILVLFFPLLSFSQQYYLKGQIQDEAGKPLQNANIILQSTGYVYYSGQGGSFGIPLFKKLDTLLVSLQGYHRERVAVDGGEPVRIVLKKAPVTKSQSGYRLSSLTKNLRREVQQQWFTGDETYASIIENQFIDARQFPVTGMALNVDRASYSNVRRFLSMNSFVPPDAVRLEEMLNYFNFDYVQPAGNQIFEIRSTLTGCPWNKENYLLMAQIFSKKLNLDSLPPSHLVFLIDVSGSMDMPNRLPLLKNGFKALVNNLREKDSVSIVVYGGLVGIALETTGGGEKEKILRTIDSLQAGGSTPGESGIKLAYSVAKNHFIKEGNNRVILATDGDFNVGLKTEEELEALIISQREAGIYLTCLGIGMGNYKDSKIQLLAQKGNGNFAYLDSYNEAEKVLLKEFTQTFYTVADDVYLNVSFDPRFVRQYRLIGFDNKVGALKDTAVGIEGGEIGSAYSMLVAFEIDPTPEGVETAEKFRMHQPVTFNLQYKEPGSAKTAELVEKPWLNFTPFVELQQCYRFASAVIMFGSLLKKSKFIKEGSWNDVINIATRAAEEDNYSQQEFLLIAAKAKALYTKKKKKGRKEEAR